MKGRIKEKNQEIEILKEMVKSSNKQAKAKDIDIQRLSQRIKRLEKLNEINKGMDMRMMQDGNVGGGVIREENEDDYYSS